MAAAARRLRDRGEANESAARGAYRLANQGSRVRVRRRDLCQLQTSQTPKTFTFTGVSSSSKNFFFSPVGSRLGGRAVERRIHVAEK